MDGGASSYLTDRAGGFSASNSGVSSALKPGGSPGLGAATAPWFSGGAEMRISKQDSYNSIRTVSVWARPADVTTPACIVARDSGSYDDGSWCAWVSSGRVYALYETDVSVLMTYSAARVNQWHHIVLVAEATRLVLYINGLEVGTATTTRSPYWSYEDGKDIYIGLASGPADDGVLSGSSPFTGSRCELALMSDALSASEVAALYSSYPEPAAYKVLADSWDRDVR
jgi:hypothetical protein